MILGAAGLVLAAALVAVLAFTGGEAEDTPLAYEVSWPVEPGPATVRSSQLDEGRNESYQFALDRSNVTEVTVRLGWDDDVGEADRFRLRVTPPNGSPVEETSRNESINLTFEFNDPPDLDSVEASNRSEANQRIRQEATDAGRGTWQAHVTLMDAPGRRPVPEASQLETEPDGSNRYNVTFAHQAFYAELGEAGPPEPDG